MNSVVDSFVRNRLPAFKAQPEYLSEVPGLQYPERLNAAVELIDRAVAEGDGDRPAVVNSDGCWSYADIKDLSDCFARLLVEEGLIPGNRVLLYGFNGAMLFSAWVGILKAGGVVVATMPLLRCAELTTIIRAAEISHAIVDARCALEFDRAAGDTGLVRTVLRFDGDTGDGEFQARLRAAAPGFTPVLTGRDDPALIAFTSGTTGRPKGCVHFHRDILAPADSFARHLLKPVSGLRWSSSAPIGFTFGLGMLLIFPWRFRGTAVTLMQTHPAALLEAVTNFDINVLATAPTAYKAMLKLLDGRRLQSLNLCVSAGEHLPAATWTAWHQATGLRIIDGIGSTEMMHIFISASGDDIRPGATGRAVPGYSACVLGDDGTPLVPQPGHDVVGRLAIKGPTGCRYLADERQANYVRDAWNISGDIYRADADGYYWYVSRSDDMIVSSGYNIAAPEVEGALHTHAAVAECAVVGVPCPERGQRVRAFVVPFAGHTGTPELAWALQEHVRTLISPYKYPRDIVFVETLPKTPTGKLQRFVLRTARPEIAPAHERRQPHQPETELAFGQS